MRIKRGDFIPNEHNLIPITDRPPREAHEIRSKGGLAKAKAVRERKALRECMLAILDLDVRDKRHLRTLANLGVADGDMTNRMAVAAALFQRAADGDVPAVREIRAVIGEGEGDFERLDRTLALLGGK